MSFLTPWVIAIAAAVTIPPLVALYFLKLKREVKPISSTLLWKRAVHDLQVNSPFQRLRNNLLLILQLIILALAALALGKPMLESALSFESTLVVLIDQSASMEVAEEGGKSRLTLAKEQAKKLVDSMPNSGRAMVIAFCDRARVVSSFDSDKQAVKRKIDSIEQTQSTSSLSEAISLAEAYSQNLIIAGTEAGSDVAPTSAAPPATAVIFTDGRINDARNLSIQRLDTKNIELVNVGKRADNVGIVAMAARRNYEKPEDLEIFATVQNFGPEPVNCDAVLRLRDQEGVSQRLGSLSIHLEPGVIPDATGEADVSAPAGSVASVPFEGVQYEGAGVVSIELTVEDALESDNRAWSVIAPPRSVRVLLVSEGNWILEQALGVLAIDASTMTPKEYDEAKDEALADGDRSLYDLVMFDRHSTARLFQGNYFFWGSVPAMEDVKLGEKLSNEIIFNWDETHPILRHVGVGTIEVWDFYRLTVPSESELLMEGETTPVMAYFNREGSNYLICGFPILTADEATGQVQQNTTWIWKPHFVIFLNNAIAYLTSSMSATELAAVRPGEPVALPVMDRAKELTIARPDGEVDTVPTGGAAMAHYARTRQVGVYQSRGSPPGRDQFAVNLFDAEESNVRPQTDFYLGTREVASSSQVDQIIRPVWQWVLLGALAVLILEWIVYNKRILV